MDLRQNGAVDPVTQRGDWLADQRHRLRRIAAESDAVALLGGGPRREPPPRNDPKPSEEESCVDS